MEISRGVIAYDAEHEEGEKEMQVCADCPYFNETINGGAYYDNLPCTLEDTIEVIYGQRKIQVPDHPCPVRVQITPHINKIKVTGRCYMHNLTDPQNGTE